MTTNLETTVHHLISQWQLSNIRPLQSANNYVAVVYSTRYKADVVLKIVLVNTHELETLLLLNGKDCVKVLDHDLQAKGLLLEYVQPGTSLKTLFPHDDHAAIVITAELIKKMHENNLAPQAVGFKTINEWLVALYTVKSKKIPAYLLKKAQQLSENLLRLKQESYLLHGDLHHENILKNGSSWIAIDPKGVLGPLEYEVGRFIMNPIPDLLRHPNAHEIIKHRIDVVSELFGFDKQRLVDWVFVQAMLSACWTETAGSEIFFNYFIEFAQTVENL